MNQEYLHIILIFGEDRKILSCAKTTELKKFQEYIFQEFQLPTKNFKLIDTMRNAQITSTRAIKEENELLIQLDVQQSEAPGSKNYQPQSNNIAEGEEIDFHELIEDTYDEENIIAKLNRWALQKKFKLIVAEGTKLTKSGYKRIFRCDRRDKNCPYRLILKSKDQRINFKIYEKLSNKHKKHSNSFL